jgi:hypothetical protein
LLRSFFFHRSLVRRPCPCVQGSTCSRNCRWRTAVEIDGIDVDVRSRIATRLRTLSGCVMQQTFRPGRVAREPIRN